MDSQGPAVQCYSLPSKLVQPDAHRDDTRSTKESFGRIFETCGFAAVSQQMLEELTRMAPAADAAFARGLTVRQSWATAAHDYPELKFGRLAVNLLLLARHSTADVERFLKVVAKQRSSNQSDDTVESILVTARHAPQVADVVARSGGHASTKGDVVARPGRLASRKDVGAPARYPTYLARVATMAVDRRPSYKAVG